MIFYVKMDFTRKARYVLDGHKTSDPKGITYAGAVSRESVSIAFTYATLNGIDVMSLFPEKDWSTLEFGHVHVKKLPPNASEARGLGFTMLAYVDTDHIMLRIPSLEGLGLDSWCT